MLKINTALTTKEEIAHYLPSKIVLDTLVAQGGQSALYRGYYEHRLAAIKFYLPTGTRERVPREIEALRKITSDFLVKLLSYESITIENHEVHIVIYEWIEGETIEQKIIYAPLSTAEVCNCIISISYAIDALWEIGIVHRDIKPGNIIHKNNNSTCLIDLGIAKHVNKTDLTQIGYAWGTEGYMSPEQCKGWNSLTYKSDIYSLGIVAIECLLGKHPTQRDQGELINYRFSNELSIQGINLHFMKILENMIDQKPFRRPTTEEIRITLTTIINN